MRFQVLSLVPLLILGACAPAAETAPPPASPEPQATTAVAPAPAPAPAPAAAPALSPEEQKKVDAQKKLERDFAELDQENKAELARITPAVRDAARSLSDKTYPNAKAALTAALTGTHRSPKSATRDAQRHPLGTLEFLGFRPNQTVLEIGPGEGWYTELLAPSLAKHGKLFVTAGDANGPKDQRPTLYALRTKLFLERLPEAYSKVETVQVDSKQPKLPFDSKLDMVLIFRGAHGMVNNQVLGTWLAEVHRSLKPNGVLGIEQHRAAAGSNPEEVSKKGYLPEAWLIEQVQAAGFRLAGKSEVNANPKDTKDYPEGVWSLPPTLREGDKDRAKYEGIGESDRMTLKFVKVALPKPKADAKPAAPGATPAPASAAAPKAASPAPAASPAAKPATPGPAPAAAPAAKPAPAPAPAPPMKAAPAPTTAPAPVAPKPSVPPAK
jgi:predicted methyltransferase